MTPTQVARLIDHTLLRPDATAEDVRRLCGEARQHGFFSVCVNPYWIPTAALEFSAVEHSGATTEVKICSVAGFPLGASTTRNKVAEAEEAVRSGAREIDMVLNIGELIGGRHDAVREDIRAVAEASHQGGAILKVILETALLNDDQKTAACILAQLAGAEFVKTSTGFSKAGATVHDVKLMRHVVGPEMGVKASGGVRTLEDLERIVAAGATRIGSSSGVTIVASAVAAAHEAL